ncbi:MAG: hypothetical protein IJA55_04185 [Clostridia bacterium]|nr:hypothetical protein [Clostridia bacterium]
MAKKMKLTAVISLVMTALFAIVYITADEAVFLTLVISFGTVAYHFVMRLAVGKAIDMVFHNKMDYNKKWFRVGKTEQRFYNLLRVRKWKGKMPTYDLKAFDPKIHSWDEIAGATCQSEIVHEIIMVLSFLPILASVWLGALPVFVITSFLSACFDCLFVMMQRYNRPRIVKVAERQRRKTDVQRKNKTNKEV